MPAKTLKFAIDIDNTDEGVIKLLHEVKPTWTWDNVEKKVLSGGYSCVMMRFHEKNKSDDAVTVRVRNLWSNLCDKQKNFELKMLPILSELEQFPNLLATFQNGYCYQYIEGKPVMNAKTGEFILTDSILRAAVKQIVKVHTMKFPYLDYSNSNYFDTFTDMLNHQYEPPSSRFPSKEKLEEELRYLKGFFDNMNTPIGLCHGDFQLGNMVWNEDKEQITFVDWEFVHVGYLYNDLAHLLALVTTLWTDNLHSAPNSNLEKILKDLPEKLCLYYYQEWVNHQKKPFVQNELDALKSAVKMHELCDALMFLMCGLCVSRDKLEKMVAGTQEFQERYLDSYLGVKKKHCGSDKFGFPDV